MSKGRIRKFFSARDAEPWEPPEDADCLDPVSSPIETASESILAKLTVSQCLFQGKVVKFCIEIRVCQVKYGEWKPAYRADTDHCEVHEHTYWPNGKCKREVLRTITSERDTDEEFPTLLAKAHDMIDIIEGRWAA